MNSSPKVLFLPQDEQDDLVESDSLEAPNLRSLQTSARTAIRRARHWFLGQQRNDGAWCADLEGDASLESETILLLAFLGREDSKLAVQCAATLIEKQRPEGGWARYPGGGPDLSGSVQAYFALKLAGHDPSDEHMQRARSVILANGGADAVDSFTRYYLAMLGQISYEQCPSAPPEIVLAPTWFPIHLYAVNAWLRTILVPLSIVSSLRPVRRLEPRLGIRELFLQEPEDWPLPQGHGPSSRPGLGSWFGFFRTIDRLFKWCQRHQVLPLRRRALAAAERWMLDRFDQSDGLGAIFPAIVWSLVALKCLGYPDDSPEMRFCRRQLRGLVREDEKTGAVRLQPCKSPVCDTAMAVRALAASGVGSDNPAMVAAAGWLLDRQISRRGDWAKTVRSEPGGWCLQYANEFYPDCNNTAMALLALETQFAPGPHQALPPELRLAALDDPRTPSDQATSIERTLSAIDRGLRWLLAMQNRDGGWGAFDRNSNRAFLCYMPFADHNAMIDPSSPDLTGRVLEALGRLGRRLGDSVVDRAVRYLRRNQNADGSWFDRCSVNYIYGTWQSIAGLAAVGVPTDDPMVVAGANWLVSHQQACGGWGESPETYDLPHRRGEGTPTVTQTAWAVLGLLAAGLAGHPAVARGVGFLSLMQENDGTWDEPEFAVAGFPHTFYLRNRYYPIYFPLMAMARWMVDVTQSPRVQQSSLENATAK
ncbi:MAG: prenyltransferase/squalene oxidase repeat-containing protein [Thermoguttaceae bacterium]